MRTGNRLAGAAVTAPGSALVVSLGLIDIVIRSSLSGLVHTIIPAMLAREMATLRRSCHRLIWIDPLAARKGFEPATAGLQAALPHVDEFVPAASVASLAALAERLGEL